ncbi:hypothetical protein [Megasphaera vaginalis (ex Srinivasan et al. 2021)]|uniref:Uncharacterized protein n=1 Tax=Megasphaera vaginalis (ex Srinivasan et al. 2021) TaxID=1111454 RepID=U7UR09_9FIRM|nr:hypothetical protein [Megasphaera vaginalis (ex Srinivasan et al. 2021)]ERT61877.1 hypothetical protein HMPREF1250_2082 [Megasphaera vaginalis (ex Srinivasan et al. 2021)]
MKSKIDITVFDNGEAAIMKASLTGELWADYQAFARLAAKRREKNRFHAEKAARRYERVASLSLFAFYETVLHRWLPHFAEQVDVQAFIDKPLAEKSRIVLLQVFPDAGKDQEFAHLWAILERYDLHNGAWLDALTGETLLDIAQSMDAFLSCIEQKSGLQRFPACEASTDTLVSKLSSFFFHRVK